MALVMGLFFGVSFDPAQYMMDNSEDYDDDQKADPLDFVFSHICGIFAASTFYFGLYIACCGGWANAYKLPEIRIPALISGIMWAIAQVSWFVANGALGFSIAFPMITSGPGFVAAIVGVLLFREIEGRKNFAVLGLAFVFTVTANALIVASR